MFLLEDFQTKVLSSILLAAVCFLLTSGEERPASVMTSQDEAETCSYVLTIPKEPCQCDCIKEFQQLTMDYERRLGEVERMLLRVLDSLPHEEEFVHPQSSQQFESFDDPNMDSIPVFFPDGKPPAPDGKEPDSTTAPPKADPTEERAIENESTENPTESDKDAEIVTPKPSVMTVKPFRSEDEDAIEGRSQIRLQMSVDDEEVPRQIEGVSGFQVLPTSSGGPANRSMPTVDVPPPVETVIEAEETYETANTMNLNLAARKTEITSPEIVELNIALKTPKKTVTKPRKTSVLRGEDDGQGTDDDEEEAEEVITPPRPPPGFAPGMEKAAGFTGEFNRPQWKKLDDFLEAAKPNGTDKRERPTGIAREPSCTRDGCGCLVGSGRTQSGVYLLPNVPDSGKRGVLAEYYCDLETNGGGWTVIQRRQNGSSNFYKNWNHYAHGFGYLDSSFWIGNRLLHALTKRFNYEIRIEFSDWNNKKGYAEYSSFYVGPEGDNFRLALGKYRAGNRGNAFSYHNGTMFSTYDRDNDKSTGECAVLRQAGFWFKKCNRMNPNGRWVPFPDATGLNGAVITWGTWSRHLYTYSLRDFRMMIRPTDTADFA